MCKTDGCPNAAAWERGYMAGLCTECAKPKIEARTLKMRAAPRKPKVACVWRGCTDAATRTLGYGRFGGTAVGGLDLRHDKITPITRDPGAPLLHANYCDLHATVVRNWFLVEYDGPVGVKTNGCTGITRAGGQCQRPRANGGSYCASHRNLEQVAA